MYEAPEQFTLPEEVKEFHKDCDSLGIVNDSENWYITPEWNLRFKEHFEKLLKLAESGEPWSQYNLGNIYLGGYLYSSLEEYEKNYENDVIIGSKWLEKAAQQGFVAAVDTLVVVGIGSESDRLREISKEIEKEYPEYIEKWEKDENIPVIMPSFFEAVYKRAYGNES
ncbi:hypothetical protein [Methylobacter sp.]|uniref:hypothetical protein n=1 Tax=Methylobacter sp. TaxID=2051955 RepID=UPI00120246D0|nr:hypothetical protein [Methylobacter sp.]TAK62244.1 MAG: hypothetical protein EPO18_11185 [Methylobacter sp.]